MNDFLYALILIGFLLVFGGIVAVVAVLVALGKKELNDNIDYDEN